MDKLKHKYAQIWIKTSLMNKGLSLTKLKFDIGLGKNWRKVLGDFYLNLNLSQDLRCSYTQRSTE